MQCYQELATCEINERYLWGRLRPHIDHLQPQENAKVQEALSLAFDSHSGQVRKSGEPFITHPVEVACILARLRMDHESIIAGLLHDTVEDCDTITFDEIQVGMGCIRHPSSPELTHAAAAGWARPSGRHTRHSLGSSGIHPTQ